MCGSGEGEVEETFPDGELEVVGYHGVVGCVLRVVVEVGASKRSAFNGVDDDVVEVDGCVGEDDVHRGPCKDAEEEGDGVE